MLVILKPHKLAKSSLMGISKRRKCIAQGTT